MKKKGHVKADNKTYSINLTFVSSTYKVVIEVSENYQLDLRNSKFGELIGFEPKIITQSMEVKLPNII